ncbi:MAG: heme lyase CcmF/NrfE family subunit, partial [Pseudomonadota bacterium]|nr:heme lyase CcmF/NrfE family subunit [Pseudomonadota bacterium]
AQYSSSKEPLFYKVTGTWGNHEGSILLWCLILAVCGAAVGVFGRRLPSSLRARVIGVLGFTSAGFLLFALTVSNPFGRLWPPPVEGQNINPLLQDPGLAIHPPILYAGYVGFAIPFAFAVAALLEGRVDAAWGRWVRPWTLASWCLLTGGIALGSWWAYYELGWGGYWFWDPVENASLLPWLTGTALLHSAIVVEKREALKVWTILLAIGTFSLSLCGTFMVRSGLLNSVHSFANDPTRGVFILALLAMVIGGSLLLFAFRAPILAPSGLFAPVSREGALVLNNILLCSIAAVVLTGTLYPPMAELLFGAKLSVGPPYFHDTVLPLAAPLFAAMSLGPVLPWKRADLGAALLKLWWVALAAAVVGVVAALGVRQGFAALGFAAAAWLVLGAFAEIVERVRLFRVPLGASRARLATLPLAAWGAAVAHAGMGVTIAGIAGMSLSASTIVAARPGQTVHLGGYDWTLLGLHDASGSDYAAREADLRVSRHGGEVALFHPSRRTFTAQHQTVSNTAIATNGLRDLYAVMGDERAGEVVLRLHVNLLAPWIWLGALVMAAGGALSLADRRLRIGAPARRPTPAVVAAE